MNRVLPMLIIVVLSGCRFSLECEPAITRTTIDFDHCYNGLVINELQVHGPVNLYPSNYTKVNAYDIHPREGRWPDTKERIKVNLLKKDDQFEWFYIKNITGHENDDAYVTEPKERIDFPGNIFKPDTWYRFNFFNPHFELFVYSDSAGNLRPVRQDLNANF